MSEKFARIRKDMLNGKPYVQGGPMSEQHGHKRRERVEERFDRYAQRVHRLLYSCDGCSTTLHQTHNYILYGNLCWTCWRLNQSGSELTVMASH